MESDVLMRTFASKVSAVLKQMLVSAMQRSPLSVRMLCLTEIQCKRYPQQIARFQSETSIYTQDLQGFGGGLELRLLNIGLQDRLRHKV